MVIPAGVLKYLDRDDPRGSSKNGGGKWSLERVSAIPLRLWLEQRMAGRHVRECRGLWCELGWSGDSDQTISRRVYRLRHGEPFVLLRNVEDWLTAGRYLLHDVFPQAALELEEEAEPCRP